MRKLNGSDIRKAFLNAFYCCGVTLHFQNPHHYVDDKLIAQEVLNSQEM